MVKTFIVGAILFRVSLLVVNGNEIEAEIPSEPVEFHHGFLVDKGLLTPDSEARFEVTSSHPAPTNSWVVVQAAEWYPGVVPIFTVKKKSGMELRSKPQRGQEMGSNPLFFAWPVESDPSARWSGFWKCSATRADGSKTRPDFEIAVRLGEIAGRFNHHTENKFASLTGGSITNQTVRIEVSYIQDHYQLTGTLKDGKMHGAWVHLNGEEKGTWTAWRAHQPVPVPKGYQLVNLWEWSNNTTQAKVYLLEHEKPHRNEWSKAEKPLCRVALARNGLPQH